MDKIDLQTLTLFNEAVTAAYQKGVVTVLVPVILAFIITFFIGLFIVIGRQP